MNPLVVQGAAQLLLGKYKSQKGMFMKNIISMAATGLVIFACLGWYLDWYNVTRKPTPDGKQQIVIDVNTNRIGSDWEKARNQAASYLNTGAAGGSPTPPTPYPNQPYPQPYQPPQQSFPNQGYFPQQPAPAAPTYQQPLPQSPWMPAAPVSQPNSGGYVFPGQQGAAPPPNLPGRPFQ